MSEFTIPPVFGEFNVVMDQGALVVTRADKYVYFSRELLQDSRDDSLKYEGDLITITARNGIYRYRRRTEDARGVVAERLEDKALGDIAMPNLFIPAYPIKVSRVGVVGRCVVHAYTDVHPTVVVLCQYNNPGSSITNTVEHIVISLRDDHLITGDIKLFEHYPYRGGLPETFQEVVFEGGLPRWKPASRAIVECLIGGRFALI